MLEGKVTTLETTGAVKQASDLLKKLTTGVQASDLLKKLTAETQYATHRRNKH